MGTGGIDGLAVWGRRSPDGGFEIEGQHLGAGAIVGKDDYEYIITVAPADLPRLAAALGTTDDGVEAAWKLHEDAIVRRGERMWLALHGIRSTVRVL